MAADLGTVRLADLDPFRIGAWLAQMRRDGMGEGAIECRVGILRRALSWGISRRMLRSNPVLEAAPSVKTGRSGLILHDLRHWAASIALRDGHDAVTAAVRPSAAGRAMWRLLLSSTVGRTRSWLAENGYRRVPPPPFTAR